MTVRPPQLPPGTVAVLIAVERYALGTGWELDGPMNDLVLFAEMLIARGVDPRDIIALASPSSGRSKDAAALPAGIELRPADQDKIVAALTEDLQHRDEMASRRSASGLLIVYVGGHGFVHANRARLLHSGATVTDMRNLDLDRLMEIMRSSYYAGHPNQLFIADMCLTESRHMTGHSDVYSEHLQGGDPLFVPPTQRGLFAASPGQTAANDTMLGTGVYSRALRSAIQQVEAETGQSGLLQPDLLMTRVQQDFARSGVRQQPQLRSIGGQARYVAPSNLVRRDSPYQGLKPFGQYDSALFFGRASAIRSVTTRVRAALGHGGFVVVSGVSGSGKSSLIRAGVVPALVSGSSSDATDCCWRPVVFSPKTAPMEELSNAISTLRGDHPDIGLIPPHRWGHVVAAAVTNMPLDRAAPARFVLVVDQFESVFTSGEVELGQLEEFLVALCSIAQSRDGDGNSVAVVIVVIRNDFEGALAEHANLESQREVMAPLLHAVRARYLLTGMTDDQLRIAIAGPAASLGVQVQDQLIDLLLQELRTRTRRTFGGSIGSGGALPLLSYALDLVWRDRDTASDRLTVRDYERTGGIEEAVGTTAEEVYLRLGPAERAEAERVFVNYLTTSHDQVDYARSARVDEVISGAATGSGAAVSTMLEAFAAKRLIVIDGPTVTVSHEALLSSWPSLRTWLSQVRNERNELAALHEEASKWLASAADAPLLTAQRTTSARRLVDRITRGAIAGLDVPAIVTEFLVASEHMHRRKTIIRRWQAGGLVTVVLVLTGLLVVVWNQGNTNRIQRDEAIQSVLIDQSNSLADLDPSGSRLSSLAAGEIGVRGGAPAEFAKLAAAARRQISVVKTDIAATAASTDATGATVALSSSGKTEVWRDGYRVAGPYSGSWDAALSPDGTVLAGGRPGGIQLWDVRTGAETRFLEIGDGSYVQPVFADDERLLIVSEQGVVTQWSLRANAVVATTRPPTDLGSFRFLRATPDGRGIVVHAESRVLLWTLIDNRIVELPTTNSILSATFNATGSVFAVSDGSGQTRLWNVHDGTPRGAPFVGGSYASIIAYDPTDATLAAVDFSGTLRVWDLFHPELGAATVATSLGRPVLLKFTDGGSRLLTVTEDGLLRTWNLATFRQTSNLLAAGPAGLTIGSDGDLLSFNARGQLESRTADRWNDVRMLWSPTTDETFGGLALDGRYLATVGSSVSRPSTTVIDLRTYASAELPMPSPQYLSLQRNGYLIASSSERGTLVLRSDMSSVGPSMAPMVSGSVAALSADGRRLARTDENGGLQLFNVPSGAFLGGTPAPGTTSIRQIAFVGEGRWIITVGHDSMARLWDTLQPEIPPTRLANANAFAAAPSGDVVALAAGERVELWHLPTKRLLVAPLFSATTINLSLAFSASGDRMFTASGLNWIGVWDTTPLSGVTAYLCAMEPEGLTRARWLQLVPPGPAHRDPCAAQPR
ncbi:hypothetical protein [Nocardia lasii]|uniref:Novel STAND NTPase 1 domain-containing protein n=1 Tax=Nocardia lasii TaxID=1616107 RepID=A0ABW1JSW3_9NOCA